MTSGEPVTAADLVVVANRLPVDYERRPDGSTGWKRSPGGLVTALEPTLRAREGAWVGWPGVPDVEVEPFAEDGLSLFPVRLSAQEVEDYYEGFSNGTLWPLYHDVVAQPQFHRHWWRAYTTVNQRFAEEVAKVAAHGATVWVQDYQLQLVPGRLRELRPDLRIGFFLHIPFPPVELFRQLPWRTRILEGLLGADLVGFHTDGGVRNFHWLAQELTGAAPDRDPEIVRYGDRRVQLGAFPISIDAKHLDALSRRPEVVERAAQIRRELGNPERIALGVDRLDYTKGIDVRLRAFHELLEEERITVDDAVMIQLATPSRERVEHYQQMRDDIELSVGRLNGEFARVGHPAVHYLHRSLPREELVAFFLAADVMLVTPLRDGMNLVAKEYVASRHDDGGVLVLSEFAGAAIELTSALLVNPHDTDGVKEALYAALTMNPDEGAKRMRTLRRQVLDNDVDRWARGFLESLGVTVAP
ncbi:Alpha,alpha-trehalose-phosphate synthase [UDP-forming] [Pseudonocardia sp. Ae168_Ps1]|uniref:alpha,alpha-trehalose-phosphate synthase (UDP-forming) n=1 Tax=unclassified Pseudonocardia TaxID=2619320 RepID=UPI00094B736C|nr:MULTISPECIES: trehalose-6-phosphate synthase [unclassified Pseudonocardia]OLL74675.1 Alpha,alpha-trehalose-phosphate synthase [UDP-forming] [Pseudonocardia sp. Ae150A_Ps1]OLL80655.1 Alpha,alpha-trehalose-phosphate synthase [UDP-forming] [Pseudonocardia sp. Ae168_Ps1]OLL85216.1 Alpha,alpha-trehalose-phosphate synthase [UDP-forming] [Pseudonocardia sp. Ae263_Ps1]OLL94759.1 Alpha,alpha-trehalose-phosphate synthase [UDP-forming] [Pseudonocardia sp. Ae356_Ps1]